MASRSARRNRHRSSAVAVKARTVPPGTVTLSGDQLAGVLLAQQRAGQLANPLPRPPQWASDPFAPGIPLRPAPINQVRPQSGRADPRLFELPISTNINFGTAPYVPWRILREAADIPLFRKCIERRKGICQLDYVVTVDPKAVAREAALSGSHEKDIESSLRDKYASDISRITDWWTVPNRKEGQDWAAWTSLLMENRLTYDASVVYPRYNFGGDIDRFEVIDGSTIKPLLDEYGGRPGGGAVAFQQILYGFPRGEFTATTIVEEDQQGRKVQVTPGLTSDQLMYERTIYRPNTPYGMSACEIALLDGIVWMRRIGWMLAEYTEGVMPAAHIEVDAATSWDVPQWEAWQQALNDHLGGNTSERLKFPLFPPGTKPVQAATIPEQYRPDYDMFLVKLVAGDFGMTATEVGFPEVGSLGASFHEGEEDVLNRVTRIPDKNWLAGYATKLSRAHLGMPAALKIDILGLESEDEAAADAVAQTQVSGARMTLNEDRARRGEPAYDFAEADMPMLISDRGIVFIEGSSQAAPPGTLLQPATVKPGEPGDSSSGTPGGTPEDNAASPPGTAAAAADKQKPGGKPQQAAGKSVAGDMTAYRRWVVKARPGGRFECNELERGDAPPEMAADPRVVFKADGDGDPKVHGPRGLAGSGTRR
jgi:hypothetical protein